jgi:hypothetical protein
MDVVMGAEGLSALTPESGCGQTEMGLLSDLQYFSLLNNANAIIFSDNSLITRDNRNTTYLE